MHPYTEQEKARLWRRVVPTKEPPAVNPALGPCWVWCGGVTSKGYGVIKIRGLVCLTHRMAFEIEHHTIPVGLQLDHLCRNLRCCNPAHLEAVTPQVNTLRGEGPTAQNAKKGTCAKGHPLVPVPSRPTSRFCPLCKLVRDRTKKG